MPIAYMLVDYVANNELLSFMDGFSGYNKTLIAVEDIPKTAFRCSNSIKGGGGGGGGVGELVFTKTFCKTIRKLQFNSKTINKDIMIESANSDL